MKENILNKSKELEKYIIKKRRDFHKHPELMFEEERTSSIVKEELEKLGYDIIETAETGVIGILEDNESEKTVALRADMDALPIQEENKASYKSEYDGKMHACGHDAHTAMLLAAAKILSDIKEDLDGTVKLVFQPGEEGGGGAKKIVEEGELGELDAIFGIHVNSQIPSGVIGTRVGPVMASSDEFKITINGDGGHAAYPHLSVDPTSPAVDIYNALQKIVTRNIDPTKHAVISLPKFKGSDAYNVIPDDVKMSGTFRTFDNEVRDKILDRIKVIVKNYCDAWDCKSEFEMLGIPYPPTVNTEKETKFAIEIIKEIAEFEEREQAMGAEDFSFYLREYPGTFIDLGTGNEEKGTDVSHHNPKFDVDEDVLYKGTAFYVLLAYRYLKEFE